ncbi:MAG: xanthine dehydrogenase family protein [Candidatus Wallbacteria bacterium]|nr:xanthine dehydrogenase family protein [Candidatus Wallbacteria bacterium]
MRLVGTSAPRAEGEAKLTGRARYVDDLPLTDFLWGLTVRSTIPYGRILSVDFDAGADWSGVTIVTAKDVPGKNVVVLLEQDQPILAADRVMHREEPIVLLAHRDRDRLWELASRVRIEYERWEPVLDIDASLALEQRLFKDDNVFKAIRIDKGDVEAAFARAARVFERTYETGLQEQAYIENQGMVATWDAAAGRLEVVGSMQCPYYVLKGLCPIMGLAPEQVVVEQAATGGAFGGKEDYPTILAAHASLLSYKSGKTVKMIYDRVEDLVATTKRHPCRTRIRTALDASGSILAMDVDATMDGGAYCTLSPVVLSRGTIHAGGPYNFENIRVESRVVATNTPPNGAFRGFGAPQTIFAMERHMDNLARELGRAPHELREEYLLRPGQTTAFSQNVGDDVYALDIQREAVARTRFEERRRECEEFNRSSRWERRGIGLATFLHGAGFTGNGEVVLDSRLKVEVTADGLVQIYSANTEMGQGKDTTFSQIAADSMGLPMARVRIITPNTARVPNSGPTVASRTAMVVGYLVQEACGAVRKALEAHAGRTWRDPDDFASLAAAHHRERGALEGWSRYEPPPGKVWDDKVYRGAAYGAYAWACYVAAVRVRLDTLEVTVESFDAFQEVGRVLNPVIAEGQIEGGVVQGIGYALCEEVKMKDGAMANANFTNYIIPTFADVPAVKVHFAERPYPFGPFGAKGIGELPMDGPGPALASALTHALGVEVNRIPATPEHLLELLGNE